MTRTLAAALALLATPLLLTAQREARRERPATVVVASSPLLGVVYFPDMHVAETLAPVMSRWLARNNPACNPVEACEAMIQSIQYREMRLSDAPPATRGTDRDSSRNSR
jgi:hypothetical protein